MGKYLDKDSSRLIYEFEKSFKGLQLGLDGILKSLQLVLALFLGLIARTLKYRQVLIVGS